MAPANNGGNASTTGPETGAMTATELDEAIAAFVQRVRHAIAGALQQTQRPLAYENMRERADELSEGDRLVVVHLGLHEDQMRYGFSFAKGEWQEDELIFTQPDHPAYLLVNGDLIPISAQDWAPMHEAYRANIVLQRASGAHEPIGDNDAHAVTLRWDDEVKMMYAVTTAEESGPFRLVINSVSVPHDGSDNGPTGYRHGVSFHVEAMRGQVWVPLVDDEPHAETFQYRAADHGSMCPPRCSKWRRP